MLARYLILVAIAVLGLVRLPAHAAPWQKGQTQQVESKQAEKAAETKKAQEPATTAATDESEEAKPAKTEAVSKYIRVRRDEDDAPLAMETAILRFEATEGENKGVVVDLIGAVHIADKSYYDELNTLFESYDVLLYELVAPEGAVVQPNQKSGSPVSGLQRMIKRVLDLDFQLDCVDYTANNFVHADMTPTEFAQSMKDRGESFFKIFMRAFSSSMNAPPAKPGATDADLVVALFAKDRAKRMKRIMAIQFEDLESQMKVFSGPDGSTLIHERNKKALRVMAKQIAEGKKKIGVFYGAGHLPDMEERLINEFKMQRTKESWLAAWDLK